MAEQVKAPQAEDLAALLEQTADLFETPEKQDEAIAAWEALMDMLPEIAADMKKSAAAFREQGGDVQPEQAEEIARMLGMFRRALELGSSDNAPNPALSALFLLRRVLAKLNDIEQRLDDNRII